MSTKTGLTISNQQKKKNVNEVLPQLANGNGSSPIRKKKAVSVISGTKEQSINGKKKGSTKEVKTIVKISGIPKDTMNRMLKKGNISGVPQQQKCVNDRNQKKKDSIQDLFAHLTIVDNSSRRNGLMQKYSSPHLDLRYLKPRRIVAYEDMSIIPTFRDILSTELPFLKANKMVGAFADPRDYLETHFRLFHEDFLRPLRVGMQEFIRNQREYLSGSRTVPKGNIRVYKDVRYEVPTKMKKQSGCAQYVRLKPNYYLNVNWEEASHLLPGSLLILSHDNFASAYIATVQNYRSENLLQRGILGILWVDQPPSLKNEYVFTMIESESFFQSYRYTLEVLQGLKPEDLPLSKYIVHGSSDLVPPKYLSSFKNSIKLGGLNVSPLNSKTWPMAEDLNMNGNQFKALKSCLTNEFAIVQGPPGTGKTFLALQVVEILLRNIAMWNPKGKRAAPILIACYTNHALDQFLEGVLRIYDDMGQEPSLIRVGGGGDSEILEKYNISKIKPDKRKSAVLCSHIVGMTTTGAAKYDDLLIHSSPRIVIVEEAAEVLESHIIPCLLPNCQHLILIGDHQQLQPCVNVQELSDKYHLDISLFERMVNNKIHLCTLNIQHRMRPEISDLVTGTIYKDLKNAPNVLTYPKVLGMKSNLYFVTHEKRESPVPGSLSKVNTHEAEFLVSLCHYMIQQGYSPKRITILATYNGQVDLIKEYVKRDEMCDEVDVTTVDGFQGKENDIILLSLVRSNDEARIGFLKKNNRICVALSRAKHGLYIIGNMAQLSAKSKTWKKIQKKLNQRSAIGPFLPIQCQIHGKIQKVQSHQDFKRLAPEGGCLLSCGKKLSCGHICQSICHKKDHDDYKCQLNCSKTCVRGHPCKAVCYEPCPPCTVKWISNLPCSHEVPVPCFVAENEELTQKGLKFCVKRCGYIFSESDGGCGHPCQGTCTSCLQGRFHVKCEADCKKVLPCGHKCDSRCFEDCAPCKKNCTFKCEHSECNSRCGEACDDCPEPCGWSCLHKSCTKLCFEICDRDPCNEPCSEILDCGHTCVGFCGEPCPAQCKDCNPFGFYKRNKGRAVDERYVLLEDCGHVVEHLTLENHFNNFDDQQPISCPVPKCQTTITRSRRYNFQIKFGRKVLSTTKNNYEAELGMIRDESVHIISSFIGKNPILEKFFPYVNTFIQKKLNSAALDGPLEREQFLKTDWWSLGVFKKFLEVAVKIVSCDDYLINQTLKLDLVERFYSFFYMLMKRPFPWSKEEIKNSYCEFQRLWHLSQSYYLTTVMDDYTNCKGDYTAHFDALYNILGARRAYDENAQNQVETIFKELTVRVPEGEFGLELSKWVEKPSDILDGNDVRSLTPVKDFITCINATSPRARKSH